MKRDNFNMSLDLGRELVVDNFAGGGGASTALAIALGREPDIAINHDGEALCMHAANHPTTEHYTEDVYMIHPGFVTKQQPIGAAWFSPTCTHFSKAKGGNLLDQKVRGLAWVTVKWGAMQMPRIMYLENVEEFLGWGPLDESGKPIKALKGRTFDAFVQVLTTGIAHGHPDLKEIHETLGADFPVERLHTGLGYKVEWRVLKACDFGAPTIRKRLFMVMRRDGLPIVWPDPTHGPRDSALVKSGKLLPYRSAADCIDWSVPCPSIFSRKKPLADATLRRVGKGYERYVKDSASPYIVGVGGPTYSGIPAPVDRPIGTLTTKNHRAVVAPTFVPLTHQGGDRTIAPKEPMPTVTCANRGEIALAVASLVQMGYGEAPGQAPRTLDLDRPLGTIVAGGGKHALVAASLVQYYSTGGQNSDVASPMPTVVTKDRIGVTCAYLAKHYKGVVGASVDQPMPTVTTSDHTSLITAHLVGIDNQRNGDRDTWSVDNPLGCIVTENKHALVTSNLVQLNGTSAAADVAGPLGTITAGGQHHAEVRTTLAATAESAAKRQLVREFLWQYCPSLAGVEHPELVTIHGVVYEVVDIGLRMLKPRELATAQGFPADYILDPLYTSVNNRGKTVTKPLSGSAQVRMVGNSVSPPPAIALIRANSAHEREIAGHINYKTNKGRP